MTLHPKHSNKQNEREHPGHSTPQDSNVSDALESKFKALGCRHELPPSLWCATMLAAQFFAVHAQQWASDLLTSRRHEGEGVPAELHVKGHGGSRGAELFERRLPSSMHGAGD